MAWLIKWWVPVIGWLLHDLRDRCYPIERLGAGSALRGGRALIFEAQKSIPKKVDVNPVKNIECPRFFGRDRFSLCSASRLGLAIL